jgi:hypothetical protein
VDWGSGLVIVIVLVALYAVTLVLGRGNRP